MNARRRELPALPRLYLVTPSVEDPAVFGSELEAALAAGDVAAVLLRLSDADERTLINRVKAIAGVVQSRDVALLLDGRPEMVARSGADGAHLYGIEAFLAALGALKPDRIVGVGGVYSRHDAMLAGEEGADYVMFGAPDRRGGRPPMETVLERLTWWAELFRSPCIGYAVSANEVGVLGKTGAEFVALGEWIWTQPGGAAAAVVAATESLGAALASSA